MGEGKQRRLSEQHSKAALLASHPTCCYCGGRATTVDHCPPRAMFRNRHWPEGYDFPSCLECNQEARADEQFLAVLRPLWFSREQQPAERAEWERHTRHLKNNQPALIGELLARDSRNEQRRHFRERFGQAEGDFLRLKGYGLANIGPLGQGALDRFAAKLAKALYYKHTGMVLDGELLSCTEI